MRNELRITVSLLTAAALLAIPASGWSQGDDEFEDFELPEDMEEDFSMPEDAEDEFETFESFDDLPAEPPPPIPEPTPAPQPSAPPATTPPPPAAPAGAGAASIGAVEKAAEGAQVSADESDDGRRRPTAAPERFEEGLRAFYSDDYKNAASVMYDYVATNDSSVENYEWAEYFLGLSLARMDFNHAAAEYLYNVAKNRTRPEILPEALIEIEKLMEMPHDERLLEEKLIVDSDFGYLPDYIASFVRYHQGLADLRAGRVEWAKKLFDTIDEEDRYKPKAIYALAVERLKKKKDPQAVRLFRLALAHPEADRELRNLCRLALARVLYEREEYKDALKIYNSVEVPELSVSEASLFLEKAWTSYWLRDFRKTMGILYALEAPSYRDFYAPEKFLLRSLLYTNLCHYIPAKREIRRFRFRYESPLENIRDRIDLKEDSVLRRAALQDGRIGRMADFRRMLAREADRIDLVGGSWLTTGLDEQLRTIYRLASQKADLRLNAALSAEARRHAEELVEFEEQMYLLDYEVGLAIYRRLRKEDARRQTEDDDLSIPAAGDKVYFAFQDEFWNDELSQYDFFIENRCFDAGGAQ
ncbi:MAG: hypothetical protein ACFB9M_19770 [Myxococcota bacterium]